MSILGIAPGLVITGYGLIEVKALNFKLLEAGVIRTSGRDSLETRIGKIYEGVKGLIEEFRPQALVLEKLYSHSFFACSSISSGMSKFAYTFWTSS